MGWVEPNWVGSVSPRAGAEDVPLRELRKLNSAGGQRRRAGKRVTYVAVREP